VRSVQLFECHEDTFGARDTIRTSGKKIEYVFGLLKKRWVTCRFFDGTLSYGFEWCRRIQDGLSFRSILFAVRGRASGLGYTG